MQSETRYGVHKNRLAERRPASGSSCKVNRRLHSNKRKRYKFSEPPGACLQRTNPKKMASTMLWPLDVAIHNGRSSSKTHPMGSLNYGKPLGCGDFIWT